MVVISVVLTATDIVHGGVPSTNDVLVTVDKDNYTIFKDYQVTCRFSGLSKVMQELNSIHNRTTSYFFNRTNIRIVKSSQLTKKTTA
jgi:hypothetical protein